MATSFIRDQPYLLTNRVTNLTLSDLVVCHLCHGILWLPVACDSCDTPFCMSCVKAWKIEAENPTRCPTGCSEYVQRKCPYAITHVLSTLQVICRYKDHGCSEVIPYNSLETHEESCDYRLKTCAGCDEEFISRTFNEHYQQCPLVLEKCHECNTNFQRRFKDQHTETRCLTIRLGQIQDQMTQRERTHNETINRMEGQLRNLSEAIALLARNEQNSTILDTIQSKLEL